MPELIEIKTAHFDCVIWAKDISKSQSQLKKTMQDRQQPVPHSVLYFQPAVQLVDSETSIFSYSCEDALFFENKQYEIEFIFNDNFKRLFSIAPPKILHRLKAVEDAFRYSSRSHSLRATINTGNDIGWFRFNLCYQLDGKLMSQAVSFEVLPTKIDMASDLNQMNAAIDEHYPLWRFTLAEKTQQQFSSVKKPQPEFLLLWLAQFERLRADFEKGLKHVVNSPHSRLISTESLLNVEKLRGRLSPKLEMAIKQMQYNRVSNGRLRVSKKRLSLDTPENRFVKSVIKISVNKLFAIMKMAKENQATPEALRLSDSFFAQLGQWQNGLKYFHHHSMFKEVSDYAGLSRESLVLQQKPGYSKIYRVWQELKYYLDLLGDGSSLSLRNVAELYEVWCFLEVRKILLDLGFEQISNKKTRLISTGLEVAMVDGLAGSFCFKRDDGITLQLAHERRFNKETVPIKTWITNQVPDILLKAKFGDGAEFIWLFDAKYRIKTDEAQDFVPDDAINQLHRYRDALIHQHKATKENTRPVFGAYALYPGYYDQNKETNPYDVAMREIGIGAFSLLPSADGAGHVWLKAFLEKKLGRRKVSYVSEAESDRYFVEDGACIPYKGTSVSRYSDLTIVVNGMVSGRSKVYRKNLEEGNAEFYHMRLIASERQNIEKQIIKGVRYLAIAVKTDSWTQEVAYLYPILGVEKKIRSSLSETQTGTGSFKNPTEMYWLFTLGQRLKLKSPMRKAFSRRMNIKITKADVLMQDIDWDKLPEFYKVLTAP